MGELCSEYKTSSTTGGCFGKIPVRYNRQCRRRESNPHSRREHDFESCASANSATPANLSQIPLPRGAPKYTTLKTKVKIKCKAGRHPAPIRRRWQLVKVSAPGKR